MMLVGSEEMVFTQEQRHAIERRAGDLFLDAAAGSGKTSVLVERFVEAVLEDGVDVEAILTITFTEKAAAQMRDRIRDRFHELGARDAARATEGAYISTIHGFCARLLRSHALQAGLDPSFGVLDELQSGRLADRAFDHALSALAEQVPGAVELIASYGPWDLRTSIQSLHSELRSRGELRPRLALPGELRPRLALPGEAPAVDPVAARQGLMEWAPRVRAELSVVDDPSARVIEALERLGRLDAVLAADTPWPGDLDSLRLPAGNGAALTTPACIAYGEALARLRSVSEYALGRPILELFDQLLVGFSERYEQSKRAQSGLDFEDLELLSRELVRSDPQVRERYRERFERVMVDELQDTNAVQLELIDLLVHHNLFTVGDAQQSIYSFRHADVDLFNRRGERLAELGLRATLRTNFRSRPEILEVIDRVFADQFGERFIGLAPGREEEPLDEPRVELLVADKASEWSPEGPWAPWRVAEARALAARVAELLTGGAAARDVVVLLRATTDMRAYERALEERAIPTYTVGGRGYWSHPQVVDMVAYLRLLANPREEEALYSVLGSPLVGASLDALVLLASAARDAGRDPWWVLRDPGDSLDALSAEDRERVLQAAEWMSVEREVARRKGVEELLDRALEQTGYDLSMLAMPGGQRRLANVRKLMRLGREHLTEHGPDLHGFVELIRQRSRSWRPDPDASEAPIESEALDAVRLMTIHRAKGLEFEIVCVADLGRAGRSGSDVVRVGADGRVGLRLARPGSGGRVAALAFDELGEAQRARAAAEERRLFYVAMTRARERLILSGAAKVEAWGGPVGGAPIGWLGPALVGDISAGEGVSEGVRYRVVREVEAACPRDVEDLVGPTDVLDRPGPREGDRPGPLEGDRPGPLEGRPAVAPEIVSVSYSALAAYKRCAYRFYAERVLGLPPVERREPSEAARPSGGGPVLSATERGTVVHALLERLDFRRPVMPSSSAIIAAAPRPPSAAELEAITGLIERFAATGLRARLGRATWVRREQRFGFLFQDALMTGTLDVIAGEPADRRLIVDYKTDRLDGTELAALVARDYAAQQLIYALAALRAGAAEVEVAHVFLEAPDQPVSAIFTRDGVPALEQALAEMTTGLLRDRSFPVTDLPHRDVCHSCPAEGGLCSWPLEMTRRGSPEQLF
jgi:ATP-dependent exoDNAse (exonuclease V) beta subunit